MGAMGGGGEGSGTVRGMAIATPRGAHPPATMPLNGVAANGSSGEGDGGGFVASSYTSARFQALPSLLLSRFQTLPTQSFQRPQGGTTITAFLAKFLELSQYPAFSTPHAELPTPASCGDHNAPKVTNPVVDAVGNPVSNASLAKSLRAQRENRADPGVQANKLGSPNHPDGAKNATNPGTSKENSPWSCSYSSAILRNSLAPQGGHGEGINNKLLHGGSNLVFPVNRRGRKTGVGTRILKMSDLRACFHLSSANAAEKLEVSLTTLKNACRYFGLKRWPGRKVRSLQSTISGLEHAIAVGQGAGMRSKVRKLREEMHQLVHGTPAQVTQRMHSPALRTADIYKRLYYRGFRSKYRSAGLHDMTTRDTGHPANRVSGLAPPTTRRHKKPAKENQQQQGPCYIELSD